jgi:hypothetical protein
MEPIGSALMVMPPRTLGDTPGCEAPEPLLGETPEATLEVVAPTVRRDSFFGWRCSRLRSDR